MRQDYTCRGCTDRHPACHDSCPKYQYAKQKRYEAKSAMYKDYMHPTGILKNHRAKLRKFTQNGT